MLKATVRTLLGTALGFLLVLLSTTPVYAAGADPANLAYNQAKVLEFLNAERAGRGVGPVARDPALDGKAQAWAEELAAARRGSHSPSVPALAAGYQSGAENLAWGPTLNAAQAHIMWMTSDDDRRSMLDPAYSNAGVGVACSTASGRQFVVAVLELGGSGTPARGTPSATPRTAGNESMSRHDVTCAEADTTAGSSLSASTVVPPPVPDPGGPADTKVAAVDNTKPDGPALAVQGAPDGNSPIRLLAVAAACLMAAAIITMKPRIAEARILANLNRRPGLDTSQMASLLDDYKLDD